MLPLLKRKQSSVAGLIIKNRTPDKSEEPEAAKSIEDCASALITAVHAQDKAAVASALKEAFQILDSEPHEEGDHVEPHSYENQNIKAAQNAE